MRSSSCFCSSSGSERLSTANVSSASPYSANDDASSLLHLVARAAPGSPPCRGTERRSWRRRRRSVPERVAELAFEIGDRIDVARAAHLLVERLRVVEVVRVDAEPTEPDDAEILVTDSDRLLRAPLLIRLYSGREEVDVGLERRLEHLVPVPEVRQQRKRACVQRVQAGAERIGDLAFVDEERHLRFAHRELPAVLDLHVLHGIPIGEHAVAVLRPLDDVDELLLEEISESHVDASGGSRPAQSRALISLHHTGAPDARQP